MKNFVLDTTVLLYDARALFAFDDNNVIIPLTVIEDIDRFKSDMSETGRNARQTSRYLDELRRRGQLTAGVSLDNGGTLFVRTDGDAGARRIKPLFPEKTRDFRVLSIAVTVADSSAHPTILVTKDVYLRIKADALHLAVEDYQSNKVDIEELYSGSKETTVSPDALASFAHSGFLEIPDDCLPNQYLTLVNENDATAYDLGRYDSARGGCVKLKTALREGGIRIEARNREQAFALDALLNDDIGLVTLVGMAGTGKTLLAVATGLYKTVDDNVYNKVLVSRPTLPMGKDIGFLPGGVEEKLTPWMYPIADNVELIMRRQMRTNRQLRGFRDLIDMGILVIEPLTYIRGRSIHNQYLIVDEAQNLTPHEIKTIVTRVGDSTKIILTGDPYQIDNPYIDSSSNGLTYAVERLKQESLTAHMTLQKGERSQISALAARLL